MKLHRAINSTAQSRMQQVNVWQGNLSTKANTAPIASGRMAQSVASTCL
jgi:hypothetical protein